MFLAIKKFEKHESFANLKTNFDPRTPQAPGKKKPWLRPFLGFRTFFFAEILGLLEDPGAFRLSSACGRVVLACLLVTGSCYEGICTMDLFVL
jgi:hypothetical protein